MTDYSEVMDLSVEYGYRYLRILAGNEEPVWCANSNCLTKGFTPLLLKQARPVQNCARIRCVRANGVSFERKADSPNY